MSDDKIMDIEILKQDELESLDAVDAIKTVAVFGAGVMGRGISQLIASKGMEVILIEQDDTQAQFCFAELEKYIDEEIARWTMTESEKRAIMGRIKISSNYDDAIYGDIVIEAIDENLESKQTLLTKLDKNVKDYEPKIALLAGEDGIDIYRRILEKAEQFLKPDAALMLEIGYAQGPAVRELLEQTDAFAKIKIEKDPHNNDRVVTAKITSNSSF